MPTAQATLSPGDIERSSAWVDDLKSTMGDVLVGQEQLVHGLLLGLLTSGHVLLEGVPGIAKTLAVSSLAGAVDASFARLQFTPDLLPADLIGTEIYDAKTGEFRPRKGPIFAQFVLADEINRAPAKVQSALLEAMQEKQVSIGGETFPLPRPFLVLATMNPIEQEGTYSLPEAQVDRFLVKIIVTYPNRSEELEIMDRHATTQTPPQVRQVVTPEQIVESRKLVDIITVDQRLREYIVDIVGATRAPEKGGMQELVGQIQFGASPRATMALSLCARANAFLEHRDFVTPGDIKKVAHNVLRHRIIPSYEAEAEGRTSDEIVTRILETVPVP